MPVCAYAGLMSAVVLLLCVQSGTFAASTNTAAPDVTFEDINKAFGIRLFADDSLWDDDDKAVAARMKLPLESRTSTQAGFRRYPREDARVLGARTYSFAMYSADRSPVYLSIVFNNRGDYPPYAKVADMKFNSDIEKQRYLRSFDSEFKKALRSDGKVIGDRLEALFGKGNHRKFGQGAVEWVDWWQWNGHSFLLSVKDDEYVGLRIMSVELAEARGRGLTKKSDAETKTTLATRVKRRGTGDVIITDIPMVDQGPKGYCVPATWERYLRYMDIPADMYVLAMAAKTEKGGGTTVEDMAEAATKLVSRSGRRIREVKAAISIRNIAGYIDQGLPLMWRIKITRSFDTALSVRSAARQEVTDAAAWNEKIKPFRKIQRNDGAEEYNHMSMIVGYNAATKEIAISDSWGPEFEERWMTVEEAEAISNGLLMIISW